MDNERDMKSCHEKGCFEWELYTKVPINRKTARAMPVGSGHVEAADKTHTGERMKRSWMRWSMAGGKAIPGICSLVRSGCFDRPWDYVVEELKRRKHANDNWNPWHEKRKAA